MLAYRPLSRQSTALWRTSPGPAGRRLAAGQAMKRPASPKFGLVGGSGEAAGRSATTYGRIRPSIGGAAATLSAVASAHRDW